MASQNSRTGGLPGSDYFTRVGEAWLTAMSNHMSAVNTLWDAARAGTYKHETAVQSWVQTADGYLEAMIEASRGPGFVLQPTWAYIDFTPADPGDPKSRDDPESLEAPVKLSRTEGQSVKLEHTDFLHMVSRGSFDRDPYEYCDWVGGSRSQILIKLNKEVLRDAPGGQYISFVLADGRTGEPPLVIVMLRINK